MLRRFYDVQQWVQLAKKVQAVNKWVNQAKQAWSLSHIDLHRLNPRPLIIDVITTTIPIEIEIDEDEAADVEGVVVVVVMAHSHVVVVIAVRRNRAAIIITSRRVIINRPSRRKVTENKVWPQPPPEKKIRTKLLYYKKNVCFFVNEIFISIYFGNLSNFFLSFFVVSKFLLKHTQLFSQLVLRVCVFFFFKFIFKFLIC